MSFKNILLSHHENFIADTTRIWNFLLTFCLAPKTSLKIMPHAYVWLLTYALFDLWPFSISKFRCHRAIRSQVYDLILFYGYVKVTFYFVSIIFLKINFLATSRFVFETCLMHRRYCFVLLNVNLSLMIWWIESVNPVMVELRREINETCSVLHQLLYKAFVEGLDTQSSLCLISGEWFII